jgi:hypothetical protein
LRILFMAEAAGMLHQRIRGKRVCSEHMMYASGRGVTKAWLTKRDHVLRTFILI